MCGYNLKQQLQHSPFKTGGNLNVFVLVVPSGSPETPGHQVFLRCFYKTEFQANLNYHLPLHKKHGLDDLFTYEMAACSNINQTKCHTIVVSTLR